MRIFQKGFNFGQDGPGNRLVYHLQGCNLSCIWCSNPEGMGIHGGIDVPPAEIIKECVSARAMFFSGGGVTFTGGEATLQHRELKEVLEGLKNVGIHTAIETNGTSRELSVLLPFVDYLIMDFKHYDGKVLKELTGADISVVKENYETNCRENRFQHIRIPVINGVNSHNPEKFAEYFACFNTENTVFEFLPYHEYGKDKWQSEYLVKDGFVDKDVILKFEEVFNSKNLKVVRT